MTRFIAHRGFSKEKKQNTVAAFERASESDAYGVETDVRMTTDGVFVAFHDKSMARLSGRYKVVEKIDFAAVQKLKIYDRHLRHKVPTLQAFMQSCRSNGKAAVVEIKSNLSDEQTDRLIDGIIAEDYLSSTIFISFNTRILQYIRARLPEQPIQLLALRYNKVDLKFLQEFRFGLDIYHRQLTKDRIRECHELGIDVNCWTVNSGRRMKLLQQWGVDYITTDKPPLSKRDVLASSN